MHSPTARIILTEDNGSNVVPQKWSAPTTSTNVRATQIKTIRHIFKSASNITVTIRTHNKASPKFRQSSYPRRRITKNILFEKVKIYY